MAEDNTLKEFVKCLGNNNILSGFNHKPRNSKHNKLTTSFPFSTKELLTNYKHLMNYCIL